MSVIPPHLFEKGLSLTVRGQGYTYAPIAKALETAESGFKWPNKPKHSFLFLGPTGVGKTETAKCISEMIFGTGELITFDMGNYQTKETLLDFVSFFHSRLQQLPPSVILFDEIEKGTPEITTLLLAMLDEGRFTHDSKSASVEEHYLIFTSNLGCKDIIEFEESDFATIESYAKMEAEKFFRPEIVARFATVVVFNLLPYDVQKELCIAFVNQFLDLHKDKVKASYDQSVITFLINKGIDTRLGARPLKTSIQQILGHAFVKADCTEGVLQVRDKKVVLSPNTL